MVGGGGGVVRKMKGDGVRGEGGGDAGGGDAGGIERESGMFCI